MQLPRRSVRSIAELPSIHTAFPAHYRPVRTHSASTASESARSPDIEDGLEVVPLEHDSIRAAPIVSAYLDEKEVYVGAQEVREKPLPSIPTSLWGRMWGRMGVKYRVLAVLGLQALVLITVGVALLTASPKPGKDNASDVRTTGNATNTSSSDAIQRGTFVVPIQFPQQQSSACLARANESRAWQCAFDTTLQLSILPSLGDDENPAMITLGPPSASNRSVHCGQQAPEIGPTGLTAVKSEGGPQYRFAARYDRTVILRGDQLGQDGGSVPLLGQPRHTTFLPGQTLWRCTFNDTLLEGFVYRDEQGGVESNATDVTSHLPYRLKLVEHNGEAGSAPYCEKVVVGVEGGLGDGSERVELQSSEAGSGAGEDDSDAMCECQWVVG